MAYSAVFVLYNVEILYSSIPIDILFHRIEKIKRPSQEGTVS